MIKRQKTIFTILTNRTNYSKLKPILLEIKKYGQKSATEVITALKKQFDLDLQRL